MTDTNKILKLAPKLQQEQIVTSYIYDLKTNSLVVELNHKYDKKTIISKIVKDDWTKTIEIRGDIKRKCVSQCKRIFTQEDHNQRFCSNIKCRNKRRMTWQKEYRHRKKGLQKQEPKEEFQL